MHNLWHDDCWRPPLIRLMITRNALFVGAVFLVARCLFGAPTIDQGTGSGASLLDLNFAQGTRELGRPLYRTFTRREEGVVTGIYSAIQDSRGLMLFGSVNCVLEYDGQIWSSIPISKGGWITGMASDSTGRVWLGGTGEIGSLVLVGGRYRYESCTGLISEADRHFGQIISVAVRRDEVYFLCEKVLIRWDGQRFSTIPLPYEVGSEWSFSSFSGRLFVHAKHRSFCEVTADHLVPLIDDPALRETTVIGAVAVKNKILLVTREKGLFEFRDSRIYPFKTDADELFTTQSYVDLAISVGQDSLVVGVQRRGLVFLDSEGRVRQTFLEEDGLPNGALENLALDRGGGLWVISDTGLTRVDPNRSLSVFDHDNGLPKSYAAATVRFQGNLFAVTGDGLYRLEPGNGVKTPPHPAEEPTDARPCRMWQSYHHRRPQGAHEPADTRH
jgi:hypothetical protein